jgi:hypothetical protein
MKLLEDTALACCVFRILVDRAGFVEVVPVGVLDQQPTKGSTRSR